MVPVLICIEYNIVKIFLYGINVFLILVKLEEYYGPFLVHLGFRKPVHARRSTNLSWEFSIEFHHKESSYAAPTQKFWSIINYS